MSQAPTEIKGVTPLPTLRFGDDVYTLFPEEEISARYRPRTRGAAGIEMEVVPPLENRSFSGVRLVRGINRVPQGPYKKIELAGNVDKVLPLPTGLFLFVGPANSGKTPTVSHICGYIDGADPVEWGEPFPSSYQTREELAMLILERAATSNVVVLDSLKNLARASGGSSMSDGIDSAFFTMLSNWSATFASYGKTLVVPVNFASTRDDAIRSAVQSIKSNATAYAEYTSKGVWEWIARAGVGKTRLEGAFRAEWKGDGIVGRFIAEKSTGAVRRAFDDQDLDEAADLSQVIAALPAEALQGAVQRAIRRAVTTR